MVFLFIVLCMVLSSVALFIVVHVTSCESEAVAFGPHWNVLEYLPLNRLELGTFTLLSFGLDDLVISLHEKSDHSSLAEISWGYDGNFA